MATILLSELGYNVVAVTGKSSSIDWLKQLGATECVPRADFEVDAKPLAKEIYSGCVDAVGGKVLANVLSLMKYNGVVAACGLAGGMNLATTVAPFILRGVQLAGVDSVYAERNIREKMYERFGSILAQSSKWAAITDDTQVLTLEQVPEVASKMLKGETRGRYIVKPNQVSSNL